MVRKVRTEEDKVCRATIMVMLGGKEHQICPLVIRDSRIWRKGVAEALAQLPRYASITTEDPDAFGAAMLAMLVDMPDTVADLFFGYAKDLNREEIEAVATDAELAQAFKEVTSIAFPLVESLSGVLTSQTR
jgi:hypothetical protein